MKQLLTAYFGIWALSLFFHALFMSHILPPGIWATRADMQYVCTFVCVVFTLTFIYLALKLMAFAKVKSQIQREGFPAYFKFAAIRNFMLLVVTVLDLLAYYFTLDASCGFCWLIAVFALFFIKPGFKEQKRLMENEDAE